MPTTIVFQDYQSVLEMLRNGGSCIKHVYIYTILWTSLRETL